MCILIPVSVNVRLPDYKHYLLEGELGVAGRAGKTVDTPCLVKSGHH